MVLRRASVRWRGAVRGGGTAWECLMFSLVVAAVQWANWSRSCVTAIKWTT